MHILIIFLIAALQIPPQSEASVAGVVVDSESGLPLSGASVEILESGEGAITRFDGSFSIPGVAPGSKTLRVRFIGYRSVERAVTVPAEDLLIRMERETLEIGEVVVTGSPIGSAVRYQAVQALGREQLQRRAAASFGEILDGSPGVAMRSMGSAPARPVVRGFDGDRVLVLENGERSGDLAETAADHAIAIDPLAADRVEIVRGPASLLYGSGAIGGVVNVLTDDIPAQWELGLRGEGAFQSSSVNRQAAGYARVQVGGPNALFGGRFAARGAGDIRTPEGVLPDTDLRNLDGALSVAYRAGNFTGGASLSLLERTYGIPEDIEEPDERIEIRMERQALRAQGQWSLGGLFEVAEVRLQLARYAHDEIEIEDGEEELELAFDQRVLSATLVAQHRGLGPIARGAVGISAFARDLQVGGEEALTPDGSALRLAAFLFEEVPLTGTVALQAAVRGEMELRSVRPNDLFPAADDLRRMAALSAALGLNVRPVRGLELGFQLAQAYRSPTLEQRYSDAPHIGAGAYEIGDPDLGLERALGADAVIRLTIGPLRAELAGFAMRISDFVVYQPTGEIDADSGLPIFIYEADEAFQLGGELSTMLRLAHGLELHGVADYVHGTRVGDDTPLPRIPPLRGQLALLLDQQAWWTQARVRGVAAQHRTAPNEEATPGYILVGWEAGLRVGADRRHVASLRVDNQFDAAYRDHLSRVEVRNAAMPGRNLNLTYRIIW
jgi:iron complex outermembrane recepter protein